MIRIAEHILAIALITTAILFVLCGYREGGWPYAAANALILFGCVFFCMTKRL